MTVALAQRTQRASVRVPSQRTRSLARTTLLMVFMAALPSAAYACPMCFTGGNANNDAFLWGSLLLMFVPVGAIGGLLYWAYRRARAQDARAGASVGPAHDRQVIAPHSPAVRALRGSSEP